MGSSPGSRQMTSAQWQRVKEVTADALELEVAHRAGFVVGACGDDTQVHREVLRLLSEAEKSSDNFLSNPPIRLRRFLKPRGPAMPYFSPGQVVADRFEILQFLNRGGMGEVYSAMDLELREKVALKTIHPSIASSPDAIDRFKQEVRHTRRITHPNVCRVYDLFSHEPRSSDPAWFLTMELLEGQTLAERIATGGPMPMKRALPLIKDMVAALSAAHEMGIVHRDFKPNNVMLVASTPETERAKVTDFGLAANVDSQSRDTAGTPAYIAPEQAAAGAAGPAADQFSLGLVICEMLTGKCLVMNRASPVEAKEQLESWLALQPRTLLNSHARSTVARCLAFEPKKRFAKVRDVIASLDGSKERRRAKFFGWTAVAAAAFAAAMAVVASEDWGDRVSNARRLTSETDYSSSPSLSGDGRWVAYSSNRGEAGNPDIWLDSVGGGGARRLTTNQAPDTDPAIAPDGKSVAFRSEREGGGIYIVGADGSGEHLLVARGRNPVFSPDGRRLAYWIGERDDSVPSGQLYVISLPAGQPRRLVAGFLVARYPAWSPDGESLVFEGCRATTEFFPGCNEFWISRANGGAVVNTGTLAALQAQNLLLFLFSHQKAWRDGHIVFGARRGTNDALWEVPVSAKDMRVSGRPRQVTLGEARELEPSLAPSGAAALGRFSGALHVWRIALGPSGEVARATKITDAPLGECCPAATRDGRSLFFTRRLQGVKDLFRKDLITGNESLVLASPEEKSWPVPNEDGTRIAFESRRGNEFSIELIDRNSPARTLCVGCSHPTSWFGGDAIFHTSPRGEIALLDINTGLSRAVLSAPDGITLGEADWSPDTGYLLFTASSNGTNKQVYAVRFPQATGSPHGPRMQLTPELQDVEKPRWSQDGARFYYLSNKDGYLCVWGNRFRPDRAGPFEESFPVMHYHDFPRFSPNSAGPLSRGFSVASGSIFINVGEEMETIWVGRLGPPSLTSVFDRFLFR
jgi:eukaryotic-like serine/threonine-protein kinase